MTKRNEAMTNCQQLKMNVTYDKLLCLFCIMKEVGETTCELV